MVRESTRLAVLDAIILGAVFVLSVWAVAVSPMLHGPGPGSGPGGMWVLVFAPLAGVITILLAMTVPLQITVLRAASEARRTRHWVVVGTGLATLAAIVVRLGILTVDLLRAV